MTGQLVPDPNATVPYHEYLSPRPAGWPSADFIIGNPPYLGLSRQRDELGDGYVDALRSVYPTVPDTADYVMYWWARAAQLVSNGSAIRAGLIATNTITQIQNRQVVADAARAGARVVWAIADHPWVDDSDGADVRVAMTVVARDAVSAMRLEVGDDGNVTREVTVAALNADLTSHADVANASGTPLIANSGLASPGFKLHGAGFILTAEEAGRLVRSDPDSASLVRPYRNGRDITARPRGVFVIDFGLMGETEARRYPQLFDVVRDRVHPERAANRRPSYAELWWRFGEPRREWRDASEGLARYIATVETSKHRFFLFLDATVAPDNMLICIGSDSATMLAILSSTIHVSWALAAGGRLGVGNDPRYTKSRCFDPFPFPSPAPDLAAAIARVGEELDTHRKAALRRDARVTMTGMYNVVEKLRTGEALTPADRAIHEVAACGVLKDLHDELDQLVARSYGWETILDRLVTLHGERVQEEEAGHVRWLRPDYQIPRFGTDLPSGAPELGLASVSVPAATKKVSWPTDVISQIGAIKRLLNASALAAEELAACFAGGKRDIVRRHIETLRMRGEIQQNPDGRYQAIA